MNYSSLIETKEELSIILSKEKKPNIKNIQKINEIYFFTEDIAYIEEELSVFNELLTISSFEDIEFLNEQIGNIINHLNKYKEKILNKKLCNEFFIFIKPKAGGEEAENLVSYLFKLYLNILYSEKCTVEIVEIEETSNKESYKKIVLKVSGIDGYRLLKREAGIHRFIRKSPFGNGKTHTSFVSVEILPLLKKNNDIKINKSDCKIDTFRASGAGGQHRNKTDSAVRLTHIPTNTVILSTSSRSQLENRKIAFEILEATLENKKKMESKEIKQQKYKENNIECWGNQIKTYYIESSLIKDHRTNQINNNINSYFQGKEKEFIYNNYMIIEISNLKI